MASAVPQRNVLTLKIRIGRKDLFLSHPIGDHSDHSRDQYAQSTDARDSTHLLRVDRVNFIHQFVLWPRRLGVGFTVIWTSCPREVRNSIKRPTEKLPARLRINAETWGCLMPRISPARACVSPRCLMIL